MERERIQRTPRTLNERIKEQFHSQREHFFQRSWYSKYFLVCRSWWLKSGTYQGVKKFAGRKEKLMYPFVVMSWYHECSKQQGGIYVSLSSPNDFFVIQHFLELIADFFGSWNRIFSKVEADFFFWTRWIKD